MKRTTIFLPEELDRDLSVYAQRSGKPAAAIVREAIAAYIVESRDTHALPSFAGAFDSGHTDTAERHDALLFGALTPHGDPAPRGIKRSERRVPGRTRKSR